HSRARRYPLLRFVPSRALSGARLGRDPADCDQAFRIARPSLCPFPALLAETLTAPRAWACRQRDRHGVAHPDASFTLRRRKALPTTETELKLIAAAAIMGLSNRPKKGYRTPAAIGTPRML